MEVEPHPQGLGPRGGGDIVGPSAPQDLSVCSSWQQSSHDMFLCFFFPFFLGPQPQHMEVPMLGVELELLHLPAYTTATATPDPSRICDLRHSSWQCQILNPLSQARDQTCILMDTSWVHYH